MFITCLSAGRRSLTEPKRLTEGLNSKVAWSAPFIYGYAGHPEKKDYLHHNLCRKRLALAPEDWLFSSARYWLTGETKDVQLSDVG